MRYLVAALILLTATAHASESMLARDGQNTVRVTRGPCTDRAILAHIPAEYRPRFQHGEAVLDGKHYPLCWAAANSEWVVLVFADGDAGRVPIAAFEPEHKL